MYYITWQVKYLKNVVEQRKKREQEKKEKEMIEEEEEECGGESILSWLNFHTLIYPIYRFEEINYHTLLAMDKLKFMVGHYRFENM